MIFVYFLFITLSACPKPSNTKKFRVIEFKNVSSLQLKKIIKTINFPAICLFGVVTGDKFLPMSLLALIIAGVNKLIIRCNGIDENPEQGLITGVNHTVDAIINRWCR